MVYINNYNQSFFSSIKDAFLSIFSSEKKVVEIKKTRHGEYKCLNLNRLMNEVKAYDNSISNAGSQEQNEVFGKYKNKISQALGVQYPTSGKKERFDESIAKTNRLSYFGLNKAYQSALTINNNINNIKK